MRKPPAWPLIQMIKESDDKPLINKLNDLSIKKENDLSIQKENNIPQPPAWPPIRMIKERDGG
jgi:hypothetical protein